MESKTKKSRKSPGAVPGAYLPFFAIPRWPNMTVPAGPQIFHTVVTLDEHGVLYFPNILLFKCNIEKLTEFYSGNPYSLCTIIILLYCLSSHLLCILKWASGAGALLAEPSLLLKSRVLLTAPVEEFSLWILGLSACHSTAFPPTFKTNSPFKNLDHRWEKRKGLVTWWANKVAVLLGSPAEGPGDTDWQALPLYSWWHWELWKESHSSGRKSHKYPSSFHCLWSQGGVRGVS